MPQSEAEDPICIATVLTSWLCYLFAGCVCSLQNSLPAAGKISDRVSRHLTDFSCVQTFWDRGDRDDMDNPFFQISQYNVNAIFLEYNFVSRVG